MYDPPCINSSTVVQKEEENILTLSQCGVLSLWSLDYDDESDILASPIKLVSQEPGYFVVITWLFRQIGVLVTYPGHALGIWICGCRKFYKRDLWASKSAGAKGDVPQICGFVHPLHPC
jgi:hypothetical protein